MKNILPRSRACAVSLLLASLLVACGDDPAKMQAAAQAAFDKRDFNAASIEVKNLLQKDAGNGEARLLLGRILLEQGDPTGAETEFRKALQAGYSNEKVVPLLLRAMVEAGQGKKAIEEFGSLKFADAAAQAELQVAMGRAYFTMGDRAKAEAAFDAALTVQTDAPSALLGKAGVLAGRNEFDGARALVAKALAGNPELLDALLLDGDILGAQGKTDEALAMYAKAIKVKSDALRAHQRVVQTLTGLNKLDEAEKALAEMKKVAPTAFPTVYQDALLHLRRSRFDKARDTIAAALKVAPDYVPALIVSATAQMRLGQHLQAQAQLEKLLTLDPNSLTGRKLLAESQVAVREGEKALETLKPLLVGDVKDPVVLNLAGQAHLLAQNFAKSTEYFQKLATVRPDSAEVRTRLGLARLSAGEDAAALQDLEAATRLEGGNIEADIALISAYMRKKDTKRAAEKVAELEKRAPNNPLTHNVKAAVLLASKDIAGGRAALERTLQLDPANVGALVQLAKLDVAEKKSDAAKARFKTAIDKSPKNPRMHLLYAQFLTESGAPRAEVRSALEAAVESDGTQVQPRIALVSHMLAFGEQKEALNVAQKAQAAFPDNPEVLRLLGRTQLAAGERQQAVTSFSKVQAMQPDNPMALVELADAQRAAGDNAAAEQSVRKALTIKSDMLEAQQRLTALMLADKRPDEALKLAREIQKTHPDSAVGYAAEAEIHILARRWPQVVEQLQQAHKRANTAQMVISLHHALLQVGKKAEAEKLIADWQAGAPRDAIVPTYLGERAIVSGNLPEARKHLEAVLKLNPNAALVLNNLAWVLHKQGDARAVEHAEAANKAAPNVPAIMETLGSILVDRGDAKRGLELLGQAATAAPKEASIHLGYARALAKTGDKSAAKKEAQIAIDNAPAGSPAKREAEELFKSL